MRGGTRHFVLVVLVLFLAFDAQWAAAQRGALTAPRSLAQLTQEAERIVHGYVVSARVEPHPQFKNLTTVVITMKVAETLKGAPAQTLEFRQFIWDIRDRWDAARYSKGQELLLMLGPVSPYGLSSPVGLEQGRFVITRDRAGNAQALNGRGNVGLFEDAQAQAQRRGLKLSARAAALVRRTQAGPVPLADLEDTVRAFSGSTP